MTKVERFYDFYTIHELPIGLNYIYIPEKTYKNTLLILQQFKYPTRKYYNEPG